MCALAPVVAGQNEFSWSACGWKELQYGVGRLGVDVCGAERFKLSQVLVSVMCCAVFTNSVTGELKTMSSHSLSVD